MSIMKGTRAAKKAADAVVRRTKQKRKSTVSKAEIGAASGTGGAVIGTIAERSRQNRNRPSGVGKAQKGFGKAMKNNG